MNRGDTVRPTAAVIEAIQRYNAESALTVRLAKTSKHCGGCFRVALHQFSEERKAQGKDPRLHTGELDRLKREAAHNIQAGELYAGDHYSALCLKCVETV